MASLIHGFRVFDVSKCYRTKELVLSGMQGQHLHNRVQKPATCNGISSAMWLTDKAKERLKSREKHDPEECPNWDCTCGAYFYRTLEKAWHSSHNIYAHVVCLEHTIIHKDGGRTNRYGVDYLLAPEKDDQKVYVALLEGEEIPQDQKAGVMYDSGLSMGYLPIPIVEYSMKKVMSQIADQLGISVLDKKDLDGCNVCLKVNEWRTEGEVTEARANGIGGEFDVVVR